jgi:hypothetical protein
VTTPLPGSVFVVFSYLYHREVQYMVPALTGHGAPIRTPVRDQLPTSHLRYRRCWSRTGVLCPYGVSSAWERSRPKSEQVPYMVQTTPAFGRVASLSACRTGVSRHHCSETIYPRLCRDRSQVVSYRSR